MEKKRKAQATIFLLLGIVLILIVVAMVMLGRFAAKKTTKDETVNANEALFDVQPVVNFVSECTTIQAKEALFLIGKQGGYIYGSQGGTVVDYQPYDHGISYLDFQDAKVTYNIVEQRFPSGNTFSAAPRYPWDSFPQRTKTDTTEDHRRLNAFGMTNIPPLNRSFGSHSIQDQIKRYIDKNIDHCLDLSIFESLGFYVDKRNRTIQVHLHDNDILVKMDYEMEVENVASGDKTTISEFQTKVPARVGELHSFVTRIVTSDVSDARYDITEETGENNFVVDIYKDVNGHDDVIMVTDLLTKINERELKYVFARKNRIPALFYISPEVVSLPERTADGQPNQISPQTIIDFYPTPFAAIDPDEDEVNSIRIENVPSIVINNAKFKVSVSDGELEDYQSLSIASQSFVNTPPSINIPDQVLNLSLGTPQTLINLSAFTIDAETVPSQMLYSVESQTLTDTSCMIVQQSVLRCHSKDGKSTELDITINVRDRNGGSAQSSFELLVLPATFGLCGDGVCDETETCDLSEAGPGGKLLCGDCAANCPGIDIGKQLQCYKLSDVRCEENPVCNDPWHYVEQLGECGSAHPITGERDVEFQCLQLVDIACQENPTCPDDSWSIRAEVDCEII